MYITDLSVDTSDSNFFVLPVKDGKIIAENADILSVYFPLTRIFTEKQLAFYKNEVLGVGVVKFSSEEDLLKKTLEVKNLFPDSRISLCFPSIGNELYLLAYYEQLQDVTVHISHEQLKKLNLLVDKLRE